MRNPVAKHFNKFNRASTHVDRKKQSTRNPELDPILTCYDCGTFTEWLALDSLCEECTQYKLQET